jgi:hypothetical protein
MGLGENNPCRVFLSHNSEFRKYPSDRTYLELVESDVSAAGHVIVDMQEFAASDAAPAQVCQEKVRGCQLYLGIFGTRYGSLVRERPEVSYTELEFDTASEPDHPLERLVFLLDQEAENPGIPANWLNDPLHGVRQQAFLRKVKDAGLTLQTFRNPDELARLVECSLVEWQQRVGARQVALAQPRQAEVMGQQGQKDGARFAVGFSFAGEDRARVAPLAEELARRCGLERVLYDRFLEAELARLDLDVYLPKLYRDDTELIVVLLSPDYPNKRWCGLEWRWIRQLIVTVAHERIMLLRVGDPGDLSELGILAGDGYIDVTARPATEISALILQRMSQQGIRIPEAADPGVIAGEVGLTPSPLVEVLANPFGDRGCIRVPARFFDREELLRRIFEELGKGSSLSLVGETQIGKSSLLAMICHKGPETLQLPPEQFGLLDMQGIGNENEFFEALCEVLAMPQTLRGWQLGRALRQRGQRYVVCLDEIEKMVNPHGFPGAARTELRGLADGSEAPLTLVIASRSPLESLFEDDPRSTSPLAGLCGAPLRVPPFSPAITQEFLRERLKGNAIQFSMADGERLHQQTMGHPARLQAAAADLYRQRTGTC